MKWDHPVQLAGRFRVSTLEVGWNLTRAMDGKYVDCIHRFIGIYPFWRWLGRRILLLRFDIGDCRNRGLGARTAEPA